MGSKMSSGISCVATYQFIINRLLADEIGDPSKLSLSPKKTSYSPLHDSAVPLNFFRTWSVSSVANEQFPNPKIVGDASSGSSRV